MNVLMSFTKRNIKLFFKDKGMFFTSLITPLILLVLYATFLRNVYINTFESIIPQPIALNINDFDKILNGLVGGQLFSSLLAVCCITVAFCSNMTMVQDKALGIINDINITTVKKHTLALSYYIATFINTLIICMSALLVSLIYIALTGWFLSFLDIILIILDVIILSMFGTALSSIINCFLSTQGQMSAVGSIVSAGYGFICGAYMPISSFPLGLQKIMSFFPGTYATSLLRNHAINGAMKELEINNVPVEFISAIKDGIDMNIYFFDKRVEIWIMFLIVSLTTILTIGIYILINIIKTKKAK